MPVIRTAGESFQKKFDLLGGGADPEALKKEKSACKGARDRKKGAGYGNPQRLITCAPPIDMMGDYGGHLHLRRSRRREPPKRAFLKSCSP